NRQQVDQVVAIADKAGIVLNLQYHEHVAARAAPDADVAAASKREVVVGRDPGGDLDLKLLLLTLPPVSVALPARVGDLPPLPAARRAGSRADELAEYAALHAANLSGALTGAADLRLSGRTRTRAGA